MSAIRLEVWIDAPVAQVYQLLSSAEAIGTWWDDQTRRDTAQGIVLEHTPGPEHGTVSFLVLANEPNSLVRWRCISEHPNDVPASEWTGTEITFDIGRRTSSAVASDNWATEIPVQTVVKFEHAGWPSESKYFAFCSYAWADVLGKLAKKAAENAS